MRLTHTIVGLCYRPLFCLSNDCEQLMYRTWLGSALSAILLTLCCGCGQTVDGITPVGGEQPSEAELRRFMRRLHLDLAGTAPDDTYLDDAVARLLADSTAAGRAAIADELLAQQEFADTYVAELENRVFGGQSAESRYQQLCGVVRVVVPECMQCPLNGDTCGDCACAPIVTYVGERDVILTSAADLAAGTPTGTLERRYASTIAFRSFFNTPNTLAVGYFDVFLGRPAELDEMDNAAAMLQGALLPGSPAGVLFHRHGSDMTDFIDILFSSENYREAVVIGVFQRYLGRRPTGVELSHFSASVDSSSPDALGVIRAVTSSREYFEQ